MSIVRYQPWGVSQLRDEINRLFNDWRDDDSTGATATWVPSVDIAEYGDRFQLFVDLPGVDPAGVEITLEDGVLTIAGERTANGTGAEEQPVNRRRERGWGRFYRRFILPDTVDAEKVKATDRHGVLEISIPKLAKAQPRRIQVAA